MGGVRAFDDGVQSTVNLVSWWLPIGRATQIGVLHALVGASALASALHAGAATIGWLAAASLWLVVGALRWRLEQRCDAAGRSGQRHLLSVVVGAACLLGGISTMEPFTLLTGAALVLIGYLAATPPRPA